jgi:hypothetical protein
MQKIINLIALLSGLVSLSVVGGGVYLYKNADVLIEDAREKATQAAVEAVSSALPKLVEAAMPDVPELPTTTGPAIPNVSR